MKRQCGARCVWAAGAKAKLCAVSTSSGVSASSGGFLSVVLNCGTNMMTLTGWRAGISTRVYIVCLLLCTYVTRVIVEGELHCKGIVEVAEQDIMCCE